MLLYTYISRFSVNPQHQQKRIIRQSYRRNSVPNHFSSRFSTSRTNGPLSLSRAKVGTHSALLKGLHTTAHTAKQGAFRTGLLSLPSDCFTRFGNPAWPGGRTAYFAVFGSWPGVRQKNAESLRDSDALIGVAAPLGCVIFLQFGDVAVFSLCAQYFLNVRGRGVLLPSACSACY